jgi:tetratricopeptide (TPR) repeat protein
MATENTAAHQRMKSDALAMARQGRFIEAGRLLSEVCKDNPRDLDALQLMGRIHGRLGEFPEAEECFRQMLRILPDSDEIYCLLGNALQAGKSYDEAAEAFEKALALRPGSADARFGLGFVCQLRGSYEPAAEHYRAVIRLDPGHIDAYGNLGVVLRALGMTDTAESCFRQVLRLRPGDPSSHFNLGNLCNNDRRYEEAEDHYRSALAARPGWIEATAALLDSLLQQGRVEDAMRTCTQALQSSPGNTALTLARANLFERRGDIDAAWEAVYPLVQSAPKNVAVLVKYAKLSRSKNTVTDAIVRLEQMFHKEGLDRHDLTKLHFSAGDLYETIHEYDRAFVHYTKANSLMPGRFDIAGWRNVIDELISVFSERYMEKAPGAGLRSGLPIFIVGMPRSGTTLTEQILSRHPDVHAGGELPYMKELVKSMPAEIGTTMSYPACTAVLNEKILDRLAARYLDRTGVRSVNARRMTDKLPGNFLHLGLIEQLFPDARIIHCTRDPVDTCLSNYVRNLGEGATYASDLSVLGEYYCEYRRLMQHWLKVVRLPIMEVNYEEMVKSQESVSRSLVEFCGLEWDERCLTFYDDKRIVDTPSYDQVRRPIYTDSVQKWKKYEKHLGVLITALGKCGL